ncbi:MAG: hypothetical protein OHK0015_02050 [Chloroflexi bacterium OHK40]
MPVESLPTASRIIASQALRLFIDDAQDKPQLGIQRLSLVQSARLAVASTGMSGFIVDGAVDAH